MTKDSNTPEISGEPAGNASDIVHQAWMLRILPPAARPYARLARLDRPIGTWLLLLPCWQGMALALAAGAAEFEWRQVWLAVLFAIGALAMRGAGCTQNDIADRDVDGSVARTSDRPIPSGEVSLKQAILFMAGLMAIGGLVLIQLNWAAIIVGLISIPVAAIYPYMKRITWWPQLFLGFAFNWGALVGWTALAGELQLPAILLYLSGIFWTLGYDTIYAHQDKEDDALVGVKSTARLFKDYSRRWIMSFYAAQTGWLMLMGLFAGLHWIFIAGLGLTAWLLMRQAGDTDLNDPKACLAAFKSNRNIGLLVIASLLTAALASLYFPP